MGFEGGKLRKFIKAAPLAALAITAQPPMKLDQQAMRPAGVRDSLEKLGKSEDKRIILPNGRYAVSDTTPPPKKPPERDCESIS